ncbi:MAG: ABC transporter substrate-binding protein [Proteobacteria bacterium]|nr:ABC transporter substrate-binding protein [Pseudomonadota bacterium]MDA1355114.1 ABC transporter substrate-binding protein [Pseudomonadota bacterium]
MTAFFRLLIFLAVSSLGGALAATAPQAEDAIHIGVLAAQSGPYAEYGIEAKRGAELALAEFDGRAGGRPVQLIFETGDGAPEAVQARAQSLATESAAKIIVGPLSGGEGQALKAFAKTAPAITFLNGASAARDLTLLDPAANFFRFTTDAAQWMAGLGRYAYADKGYRRIVTLGENYSFPYIQVMGFLVEFCALGGSVAEHYWLPLSDKPYAAITAQLAAVEADAIFITLDGSATAEFLTQYWKDGGTLPIIGGSVTFDPALLGRNSLFHADLSGAISASPLADGDRGRGWQQFVADYRARYPDAAEVPSLFAFSYYVNTKAALLALDAVDGELSGGQTVFREALAELSFETPAGRVSLDENRQAIANNYVLEITLGEDNRLHHEVVYVATNVDQTLGLGRERYLALGGPGPQMPSCP